MSETAKALAHVRRYAAEANDLKVLVDTLERLGSLENAEVETKARLDALRAEEDDTRKRIAEAKAGLDAAAVQAQTALDQYKKDADAYVANTLKQAEVAKVDADAYNKQREAEADTKVSVALQEYAALNDKIVLSQKTLEDLESRVAKAKEAARAFLS